MYKYLYVKLFIQKYTKIKRKKNKNLYQSYYWINNNQQFIYPQNYTTK